MGLLLGLLLPSELSPASPMTTVCPLLTALWAHLLPTHQTAPSMLFLLWACPMVVLLGERPYMADLLPILGLQWLPHRGRDCPARRGFLPSFFLQTIDIAVMSLFPSLQALCTHPPPQAKHPRNFAEKRGKRSAYVC